MFDKVPVSTTDTSFLSTKSTTLQVRKMDKYEPLATPFHTHTPVNQTLLSTERKFLHVVNLNIQEAKAT